ncbi:P-loop containing nucleoside triphosphate hydrolase protein [Chytriomyces cf. hyalinus JEL632]|nr:P-loop containing nucleoside triphosphate hydrolase protein [Chytriomyces cf. hyalinus JEL632]
MSKMGALDPEKVSSEQEHDTPIEQPELPLYKVGFINRLTFSWMDRLFVKGWKKPLVFSDMYQIPDALNTQNLADTFDTEWKDLLEKRLATGDKKNPNGLLLREAIWNLYGKRILSWGILLLLSNLCNLFAPYFVKFILEYSARKKYPTLAEPVASGFGLVFGLLALQVVGAFFSTHFTQEASIEAVRVRTMMTAVIYRKSLRLSSSARQEFTSGSVINLVSTDTNRVEQFINMANFTWTIPVSLTINIVFLVTSLGWPALAGIGLLVASGPLQAYLFSLIMKIRAVMAPITGKRVNLTTEVLSGVRVIKFFAWENAFFQKVSEIRSEEVALVLRRSVLMAYVMTQGFAIPILCSCVTFIIYGSLNVLNPANIFSAMSWFNQLRMPLFMLPMLLNTFAEFNVALRRIEALLLASEVETTKVTDNNAKYAISIENGEFEWTGEVYAHGLDKPDPLTPGKGGKPGAGKPGAGKPAAKAGAAAAQEPAVVSESEVKISSLKGINLNIERGSLVAVVGAVGSGKSSLLNALIGEMRTIQGSVVFSGSLGYAAQTAWIQNANLKENILFGKPYNKERYLNALLDAALLPDLKVLPDGDQTSIGERGINLSGGQKQRVNLARLIYNDAEIVLIDDPLSAVDAHVGKHLFNNCIKGALSSRTRILVTHQLHFLPQCDRVVVLKDGAISEQGTYQELIQEGGEFAKMIASYGSEEDKASSDSDNGDAEKEIALDRERQLLELAEVLASKKAGKDIMSVEDQETGKVPMRVWLNYVKASGGMFGFVIPLVLVMLVFQLARTGNDLWLTWWTGNNFNLTTIQYIAGYVVLAVLMTLGTFGYALFFAYSGTRASRVLHEKALERILRAPTSFYDTTPLGRILNRFSRDVDAVDNNLSFSFRQLISQVAICLSTFIVMCSALPWFTVAIVPSIVIYYWISAVYRTTAREMKRLDSTSKSPLYANFGETLIGIATIRAYGDERRFMRRNDDVTDRNNSPYFLLLTGQNWLSLRLQIIGAALVLVAALLGVITDLDPALFGLTLSYSLSVTQILSFTIQNFTQTEIAMNSVERMETYAYNLPVEADAIIKHNRPDKEWPREGIIEFKEVVMRYAPNLPIVLDNVSFAIKSREKVGIVGRTGSGKSSLMQALFRMVEPASGKIFIDGVDIGGIGLSDLRSRIAIIPQDPVVFSGTFRSNMDPFAEHSDNELWDALSRAGLKAKVSKTEKQLDGIVDSGGENLSVGERQLLCLSRAMLKSPRILIMDEATANVDYETDALIQKSLREDFKDCTVLTIAHRLNTVIDYDKIMFLEKGAIAEFDSPGKLLQDESSRFFALVAETGEGNAAMLKEMANGQA